VLSGYVTGTGTDKRLLKWDGTGSVASDSSFADSHAGTFVVNLETSALTADGTYAFTDPYIGGFIITGTDIGGLGPPYSAVATFVNDHNGQIDSSQALLFDKTGQTLYIGNSSLGGTHGIALTSSQGGGSIYLQTGGLPVMYYTSPNTGGRHLFTGNPGGSFGVVTVDGRLDATTFNKMTITAPTTASTLAIADGKTFTVNQTLTLTGTTGTTHTFPATTSSVARIDDAQTFVGAQTFSAQDVHTLGIDLSTSGIVTSSVANSGSNIATVFRQTNKFGGSRPFFEVDWYTGAANQAAFTLWGQGASGLTKEMRLWYDASNYLKVTVASGGIVNFNSVGSADSFGFGGASGNFNSTNLAFFGVTAVARASAYTQTYSTASHTHPALTATTVATTAATLVAYGYTQAQADAIPVAINALLSDLTDLKKLVNAIIDDHQAYGLFQ